MKKHFLMICFLVTVCIGKSQFLIFLDKGDEFTSPETDMVVMDKISFAKLHYTAEKFDTLRNELFVYDSLLKIKDSAVKELREDYNAEIESKQLEILSLSESYQSAKAIAQQSIDKQNQLQVDYLKLEKKNRRIKRWRSFFMGTSLVCGTIIFLLVR